MYQQLFQKLHFGSQVVTIWCCYVWNNSNMSNICSFAERFSRQMSPFPLNFCILKVFIAAWLSVSDGKLILHCYLWQSYFLQKQTKEMIGLKFSISFQLLSDQINSLTCCAHRYSNPWHTHTCSRCTSYYVSFLCTEADAAVKRSFPPADDRAHPVLRWLITSARGPEKRTHTSVGSLSL